MPPNPRAADTSTPRAWRGAVENHPVCRGHFAALVFSGDADVLGELPGEMTARSALKFALPDPRLSAPADFARTPGMPLATWPQHRVLPTPGVCFVLSDRDHPALASLLAEQAEEYESAPWELDTGARDFKNGYAYGVRW